MRQEVLKVAYNQGILAAYAEAGLVKEAGTFLETAKALGQTVKGSLQKHFGGLREAAKLRSRAAWAAKGLRANHPLVARLAEANKALTHKAMPWLATGGTLAGAGALGYGAHNLGKKLWPRAFGD